MTCWSLVVYLLKCCLKFIHLVFSTLSYPFTNYPLLRGRGKKTHCVCEEYFPLVLKKQLRNVPFIFPKPMFTFLNTFDYFFLSTHSIFQILLIAFKVFLSLLVLDVYRLQWMLDYTWDDWEKSLEDRDKKSESLQYLSHFQTMPSIFFLKEYIWQKYTYETVSLF